MTSPSASTSDAATGDPRKARKVSLSMACDRCGVVAYWRVLDVDGTDAGAFCGEHADAAVKRLDKAAARAKRVRRDGRPQVP